MKEAVKTKKLHQEINFGGTGLTQRALFAKNLAVMIAAGLTIIEALRVAAESAGGKLKNIILSLANSVESGSTLADAMGKYPRIFSGLFINAVYAGERSGTLSENLEYVAEQLRKEKELSGKIRGALLYPAVVLVATFALGLAMAFFILPKITPLFEGLSVALPASTRALLWISKFIGAHGTVLIISIISAVAVITVLVRQKFSRVVTHWIFLHVPILRSVIKHVTLARFCRTLGTLLKSGLHIDEAVAIAADTSGNYYYTKNLRVACEALKTGSRLATNLAYKPALFPPLVTRMIMVGEESGSLEGNLLYLASFYEDEIDSDAKTLTTSLEPILLLFVGCVVGFLALSIITPIYNITGSVGR